ncbi:MAG: Unknown protein [uncultured Sulfurovum sp.]|uniref:Uncharacterized protein n=1 Tax=uncultured Sulfurovum sp. TaxID=269237 RepID=A0A6S6T4J1_9BACT|nr:MAG: Unknown protein [uncultured Sulfurovum sp.]
MEKKINMTHYNITIITSQTSYSKITSELGEKYKILLIDEKRH